jgi:hypothetical protein
LEASEDYTDFDISSFREAIIEANPTGFNDALFKRFMSVIMKKDWNKDIEGIVHYFVDVFSSRGETVPCASNLGDCNESCPLHELESQGKA